MNPTFRGAVYTLFGAYLRNGLTVTTTVYVAQNRMYFSKERIERGTSESPRRPKTKEHR